MIKGLGPRLGNILIVEKIFFSTIRQDPPE